MANKVFVRGFDYGTTEQGVRDHCESAGLIESVEFFGKGSAVVTYVKEEAAQEAIATLHKTTLPGNVRYIEVKTDEGGNQGKKNPAKRKQGDGQPVLNRDKVYVRGFEYGTTDDELETHFGTVGNIVKIQWLTKGSVVITYADTEAADQAVSSLDKSIIPGKERYIEVKIDDPKRPKSGADLSAIAAWFGLMPMGGGSPKKKKSKKANGLTSKKPAGPRGPDLPRERISSVPISGTVLDWVKKWGWIKPEETPSHPKASNHAGKIYVHMNDLVGIDSLEKGNKVTFHIYADDNGLGAEEVELGL